jgi:hypothetical protein
LYKGYILIREIFRDAGADTMSLPSRQLPPVVLTLFHFPFPFTFIPLPFPSCFKSKATMTKKDPLLAYTYNMVNLGDFDNSEIRPVVLPRTERDYERTLRIFDRLVCIS